jgi:hypothetical protein
MLIMMILEPAAEGRLASGATLSQFTEASVNDFDRAYLDAQQFAFNLTGAVDDGLVGRLVIVDTLAAATTGADGSSDKDMAWFVSYAKADPTRPCGLARRHARPLPRSLAQCPHLAVMIVQAAQCRRPPSAYSVAGINQNHGRISP